jgi:hypothetical protein
MRWPATIWAGSVMLGLAAMMAWIVTPNLAAMALRVSPAWTT